MLDPIILRQLGAVVQRVALADPDRNSGRVLHLVFVADLVLFGGLRKNLLFIVGISCQNWSRRWRVKEAEGPMQAI
jgi:hypothetical protein